MSNIPTSNTKTMLKKTTLLKRKYQIQLNNKRSNNENNQKKAFQQNYKLKKRNKYCKIFHDLMKNMFQHIYKKGKSNKLKNLIKRKML